MASSVAYFRYYTRLNGGDPDTTSAGSNYANSQAGGVGYVYDVSNDGSDNLSQLGDINPDVFAGSIFGATLTYTYLGKTADGIAAQDYYGNYFLFSNTYYPYDANIHWSSSPYDLACYVTGTLIATPEGQAPVESLAIGDKVLTASGEARAIRWIGHRAYSSRFAANNPDILPILFKAGSLADNVPARDLMVSPKHAMFIDGVLIAAEDLVNGETIVQATRTDAVEYWHIELDSHDVLLAEGAPSESFVDDHSRGVFHNAPSFTELYPDAERQEAVYCAPRVSEGHTLHAIRQRLAGRVDRAALAA